MRTPASARFRAHRPVTPPLVAGLASLWALLTCFLCRPAAATTWVVYPDGSGDAPTIQAAMDSAAAGDVVLLGPGTYFEHDIQVKSGIALLGAASNPQLAVIDAEQSGRGLICDGVGGTTQVRELTVRNAAATGDGGGIYCTGGSSPRIEHVFVEGCSAARGAGFFSEDWSCPHLTSCTFSRNAASLEGGGFYCGGICCPQFTDCIFAENSAASGGGGLLSSNGLVLQEVWPRLTRCLFFDNHAEHGGALTTRPRAFVILEQCSFSRNSASNESGAGGAIFTSTSVTLDACTLAQNQAHRGGGVYCGGGGGLTCWDSSFEANLAVDDGGAVYLDGSGAQIRGSAFVANSAPNGTGGAVCCYCRVHAELTECLCAGNSARTGGAFSLLHWSRAELVNCTLAGNSATSLDGAGAGLHLDRWSDAVATRCIIADSRAGASLFGEPGAEANLICCSISGNVDGNWVGAIAAQAGKNGNTRRHPLFCFPRTGDYSLHRSSPCLPRYSHGCDLIGTFSEGDCENPAARMRHSSSWAMLKAKYR